MTKQVRHMRVSKKGKPFIAGDRIKLPKYIRSPLRYPGGKSRALPQIIPVIDRGIVGMSEYREPMVGGGSVFITVRQRHPHLKIWINDLDKGVYLFWKTLRDDSEGLIRQIVYWKNKFAGREKSLYLYLKNVPIKRLSDVQQAARFFILNRITFSGLGGSGGYSPGANRFTMSSIDRIRKAAPLMKGVRITNWDYSEVMNAPELSDDRAFNAYVAMRSVLKED